MKLISYPGGIKTFLEASLPEDAVGLAWLGQAGFFVRRGKMNLLIDPYLSDCLVRKYAGTEFPHARMMPAPARPNDFRDLDLILCSHRHNDHMDSGSLPELARNNSRCRFLVPKAEKECAVKLGLDESRLVGCNDGDTIRVSNSLEISAIAAAHETLMVNQRGEHHFLGFVLRFGGVAIYHSGDCVVYPGLANRLRGKRIALALLPVNGRSERLTSRGIAGNMSFDEAVDLCLEAEIGCMVPHHFGMFAFNTVDVDELRHKVSGLDARRLQCVLPEATHYYLLMDS